MMREFSLLFGVPLTCHVSVHIEHNKKPLKMWFFLLLKVCSFSQRKEFPGLVMMFLAVEGRFLTVQTIKEGKLILKCHIFGLRNLICYAFNLVLLQIMFFFLFSKGFQKKKSNHCSSIIHYMAVTGKRFPSWLVEVLTLLRNAFPKLVLF